MKRIGKRVGRIIRFGVGFRIICFRGLEYGVNEGFVDRVGIFGIEGG